MGVTHIHCRPNAILLGRFGQGVQFLEWQRGERGYTTGVHVSKHELERVPVFRKICDIALRSGEVDDKGPVRHRAQIGTVYVEENMISGLEHNNILASRADCEEISHHVFDGKGMRTSFRLLWQGLVLRGRRI